jgi:tetratricopeptide (TPR) repeat protein
VLLHEYAHHFMMHNFPGAFPAWFIEGFAEFHSTAKFDKDGGVGIGTPALHRAYGLVLGDPIPIQRLMTYSGQDLGAEQREALYGRGWLLTHFLTFEPERTRQLGDYIRRLNKGDAPLEAATASFGDLKKLDRELDHYLKQRKMKYLQLGPEKVTVGAVQVRRLTPGANAVMNLKIRSRRGVNAERARALVPELRRAAAPFPKDVMAQATLAEAEFDAGNYKEAEAAADRAIAADPKSIDGLIYKARAKMALAAADSSGNEAVWKEVRKAIVAANRADPDDPEPLILFYTSYREQGIEPTANATMGLVRALELAPQDGDLRMMAAYQFLIDGKPKEARSALAPIAFDPHGGKKGEAAAAIIASLDSDNDARKALVAWNGFARRDTEDSAD